MRMSSDPMAADHPLREVLVIQTARLGDLVQTAPLLRGLRRTHPGARITLLAQTGPASLLEGFGLFDRLVALPYAAFDAYGAYRESVHRASPGAGRDPAPSVSDSFPEPFASEPALRTEYDLLINASNDLGSAALCADLAARRKLGRIQTYAGELRLLGDWAKYLYSMAAHRRENLFNLVDIQMGMAGLPIRPEPVWLPVEAGRRIEARALLRGIAAEAGAGETAPGPGPEGRGSARPPVVALQAGASAGHRAWSPEHFAALGAGLVREAGARIILVGDASERDRCQALAARIGPGAANLAGHTSLAQLHAVLGECDLLVSNDTGTIHVAAAAGTPTLGLYFSTAHYAETAPYGAGHAVLQVEIPCAPCDASSVCPVQRCREYLGPEPALAAARWLLAGAPADSLPPSHPHLSLYRSRFLADGTLAYLPARPEAASPAFQEALVGRLLWQKALGLSGDPALDGLARDLSSREPFRARMESLASALERLERPVQRGVELTASLKAAFAAGTAFPETVRTLHAELAGLASQLAEAARPAGLCGAFLHFEMMDMDFTGYPALAGILEGKYRRLAEWMAHFRRTLAAMGMSTPSP